MRGLTNMPKPGAEHPPRRTDPLGAPGGREDRVITRLCRPRRDRYRVLSLLWIFPSSGALVILALELRAGSWRGFSLAALAAFPVQGWIALLLLLLHLVFVYLARRYRTEPWHEVSFPAMDGPDESVVGRASPRSESES